MIDRKETFCGLTAYRRTTGDEFADSIKIKTAIDVIHQFIDTTRHRCYAKETWLDHGAKMFYRTIIVYDLSLDSSDVLSSYQALSPRQFDQVVGGTFREFAEAVAHVIDYINSKEEKRP